MVGSKKHSSAKNKDRPSSSRSGKDKVSVAREYGEGLVGSRIRVWWPIDREFYEGMVDSYASSKMKHRVLYDDGDVENLDLKKERWELIEGNDAEANEDESADESSEATPELKSKARSGKISDNSEELEKQKCGVKNLEKSKDVEKKSPKPEIEKNGKMGDIGGKIVAAASRMSGRFRSKENGHEKETPKALKSSKEVSESKNPKQKRPPSSSGAVYGKAKKPRTFTKKSKSNYSAGEDDDASDEEFKRKSLKSKIPKQKKSSSSAEAVSEDGDDAENDTSDNESKPLMKGSPSKENGQEKEIPKAFSKRTNDADDDMSDDDSKLLVSFLKKSPEAVQALMEKLKGKKEKEAGEGSSRNETVEEESS